jgi:hypothetical protein
MFIPETAEMKIFERMVLNAKDSSELFNLNWDLDLLKVINNPVTIDTLILKRYAGIYGERVFTFENGKLFYQKNFGKRGQNYLSHRQKELGMKTEDVCYTAVEYVKNKTGIKDLIDQLLESKGKKFTSSKDYNNHYQICSDIASKLLGPKQKENFINFVASNANKDSAAFYQNNLIQNRRDKYYKPLAEDVGKQKTREWCDSFSQGIKDNLN